MKKTILFGFLILHILTSCYSHSYRTYRVTENLNIRKKFFHKDRTKIHKDDLSSLTKKYHLPKTVCEDTLKLKYIATKIYQKNHKRRLHKYFDNSRLVMTSDTTGYFSYYFRIIHGHDQILYDKKKCVITVHKAWTGNF